MAALIQKTHSPWLDWLRFLAAFQVLLAHARGGAFVDYAALPTSDQTIITAAFFAMTRLGYEAVIAFFVLSGFLVGGRAVELAIQGKFSAQRYIIDRTSRIMTPLIPAILFTAIVALLLGEKPSIWTTIGNLFSLQGILTDVMPFNLPLWSLSFEVWFYIAGGIAAFAVSRRGCSFLVLALGIIAAAALTSLGFRLLALWALGALAYLYRPKSASPAPIVPSLLLATIGTAIHQLAMPAKVDYARDAEIFDAGAGEFLLAAGLTILLPNLRVLSTLTDRAWFRSGQALAAFSFSLYLTHYPVVSVVQALTQKSDRLSLYGFIAFGAGVSASIVIAAAFYWAFESRTETVRTWMGDALSSSRRRHLPSNPSSAARSASDRAP